MTTSDAFHWLTACAVTLGSIGLFFQLKLLNRITNLASHFQLVLITLADVSLSEDEQEQQIQSAAIQSILQFLIILGLMVSVVLLPLLILGILDSLNVVDAQEVVSTTLSLPFIAVMTVVGLIVWRLSSSKSNKDILVGSGFKVHYSRLEKTLHLLAFASRDIQIFLSKLEDKFLFKGKKSDAHNAVFIASLPRSGTTLLMELCLESERFVTHTYRDMPFIHTPLFWSKFSRLFRKESVQMERAHGDGMSVSVDSPEAFEEVIWLSFWRSHYQKTFISSWAASEKSKEFNEFFLRHQAKLISRCSSSEGLSYLSKNNLNIARTELILNQFPTSKILIPFRHPHSHCRSMHHQHLNFLDIHQQEEFAKLYMAGIGHFDFGENLKPIQFNEVSCQSEESSVEQAKEREFWYRYWVDCFSQLLMIESDRVMFVDYDALCSEPQEHLTRVAEFLSLDDIATAKLVSQSERLKKSEALQEVELPEELRLRISEVYDRLRTRSKSGQLDVHSA